MSMPASAPSHTLFRLLTFASQSIIFANLIEVLSAPSALNYAAKVDLWSLVYLVLGMAGILVRLAQGLCFSYASEKLTSRAREVSMRAILRQDMEFFDQREHSSGALTAFLSSGATSLNSLSGAILGSVLSFCATIIGGVIVSLVVGWKLALVCTATIPFVAGCGWVRLKILTLFDDKIQRTQDASASYASEAVTAIRTVASLSLERQVLHQYNGILSSAAASSLHSILKASALYAASQSVVFLCAALGFWYGGTLIASHEYDMRQFFICFAALISGSQSAGTIFSFAPDISKALHAGRDLQAILSSPSRINVYDSHGKPIDEKAASRRRLQLHHVSFRYPSRPQQLVLDRVSLTAEPGQSVAIVGTSGSGKSTILALIERFFEPGAGRISFADQDIAALDVNAYRGMISLVSQESTIFQGTIRENLLLGAKQAVSEEDLANACKDANIYDFISSLP